MRLVTIFVLAVSIHLLYAQEVKGQAQQSEKSFVEKLRPQLVKFLGSEWTTKLLGVDKNHEDELPVPAIPKVLNDARSIAIYNRKEDKIILKPEVEQKFYYTYIQEVFEATRQTKPNEDEIAKLMNVLSQGGTREGVYRSLVLDSVYGGMENWDKGVKSATADFAVYFYEKYLGKKIAKKSFEGMTIYTLKRLITEKSLEVADAFGDDSRADLEQWYGVMSGDLAAKFPQIWSNTMRKKTSAIEHRDWAKQVPLQHIKSEIIIKVHSAFNSMI